MACFPVFCSPFCSMLMLGLYAHMLHITFMVTSCLDLRVVCMFYAPILIPRLHMLVCLDSCPSMSMC